MNKLIKLSGVLLLTAVIFSSCSKQKYTASFAPSNSKRYVKIEAPATTQKITKESVLIKNEAVVAAKEIAAPVVEKNIVTPSNLSENSIKENTLKPAFTEAEAKQMKKDVRKTMFKAAKRSLFKKAGDSKLIPVICAIIWPLSPLGVYLYQGGITNDFWLDLVLLLTFIGAMIYALLVIFDVVSIA